jgi:hypothetical protein
MLTVFNEAGKIEKTVAIAKGGGGIGAPALVPTKNGGMRVFFNGILTPQVEGLLTASAPAAGTPWSKPALVTGADLAHTRSPSAAVAKDFTPFQAWHTGGAVIALHRGLGANAPRHYDSASPPCCAVQPNLVTDQKTGDMLLAWCTDSEKRNGIWVQQVKTDSGLPAAKKEVLDRSATSFEGKLRRSCDANRTAIAARFGGGIFVAARVGFPNPNRTMVWKVGTDAPQLLSNNSYSHSLVAIAGDREGRIWVAWAEGRGGGGAVLVRRSDPKGANFGPATVLQAPAVWNSGIYDVALSAGPAGADVFVRFLASNGKTAVLHTRVAG